MDSPFRVMIGMGACQKPMYYDLTLPGPNLYHHLRGEDSYDVQRQLWVVGENFRNHLSDTNDPESYRCITHFGPAGNQAGSQSACYYNVTVGDMEQ
jgi:hypothetical protein